MTLFQCLLLNGLNWKVLFETNTYLVTLTLWTTQVQMKKAFSKDGPSSVISFTCRNLHMKRFNATSWNFGSNDNLVTYNILVNTGWTRLIRNMKNEHCCLYKMYYRFAIVQSFGQTSNYDIFWWRCHFELKFTFM